MKLYPECGPCMLKRTLLFCRDKDDATRYKVVREVCKVFSEKFSEDTTTTEMAYKRNEATAQILNDEDPLRELKEKSIEAAEKIYPKIEGYVSGIKDDKKRFKTALKVALAGNILEFGAQDHKVSLDRIEDEIFKTVNSPLAIDDSEKVYDKIRKSKEVLYVTDNAGELVFDRVLIKEIQKYAKVTVAPLSRPVQDDAGPSEIKKTGIDMLCPIIPRSDSIGVWFERCNEEFIKKWDESDFIIAKGMGCYETLVDRPDKTKGKVGLLMKAKCRPVAKDVGVPLGGTVIKII